MQNLSLVLSIEDGKNQPLQRPNDVNLPIQATVHQTINASPTQNGHSTAHQHDDDQDQAQYPPDLTDHANALPTLNQPQQALAPAFKAPRPQ